MAFAWLALKHDENATHRQLYSVTAYCFIITLQKAQFQKEITEEQHILGRRVWFSYLHLFSISSMVLVLRI